jgi:hypothetical protein
MFNGCEQEKLWWKLWGQRGRIPARRAAQVSGVSAVAFLPSGQPGQIPGQTLFLNCLLNLLFNLRVPPCDEACTVSIFGIVAVSSPLSLGSVPSNTLSLRVPWQVVVPVVTRIMPVCPPMAQSQVGGCAPYPHAVAVPPWRRRRGRRRRLPPRSRRPP